MPETAHNTKASILSVSQATNLETFLQQGTISKPRPEMAGSWGDFYLSLRMKQLPADHNIHWTKTAYVFTEAPRISRCPHRFRPLIIRW